MATSTELTALKRQLEKDIRNPIQGNMARQVTGGIMLAAQLTSGGATQAWVEAQNYLQAAALTPYALQSQLPVSGVDYLPVTGGAFTGAITAPSFIGSGAALTGVNASQLGGIDSVNYARIGLNNNFSTDQTVAGVITATGGNSTQWNSALAFTSAFAISDYYTALDARYQAPEALASVAFSGSYNDLTNTPTVPVSGVDFVPKTGGTFSGNIATTGTLNAGSDNGFYINGSQVIYRSSGYTILADPSRAVQLYLSAGSNFYDSTSHTFRSSSATNYAVINASGLNLSAGVFTGNGSGLTSVNPTQLAGIDAVNYARADINPNFQSDVSVTGIITATGGNSGQWNNAASFSSSFAISDYYLLLDARYQAPEALASVAFSGSYNDLTNTPTVPVSGVDFVPKTGGTFSGNIATTGTLNAGSDNGFYINGSQVIYRSSGYTILADPSRAVQLYLSAGSNFYDSTSHTFRSSSATNYAVINASGLNLSAGVFTGNGSGLTSVNPTQLAGIDAVNYARADINPNFQSDVSVTGIITATGGNSGQWNNAASFSSSFAISDYYLLLDARYQAPEALATVAFSGSYNDLTNTPTVPVSGVDFVPKTGGTFSGSLNVTGNIEATGTVKAGSDSGFYINGAQVIYRSSGYTILADPSRAVQLYLSAGSNFYDSTSHTFRSSSATNYAVINASGLNLSAGVFTGNGSGLTSVNPTQLAGIDAVNYARADINPNFQSDVSVTGIITATGGNSGQWNNAASFSSSFAISDYYLLLDARYQAPEALATVAFSGSYNDLTNTPTVPVSGVDFVPKTGGTFSGSLNVTGNIEATGTVKAGSDSGFYINGAQVIYRSSGYTILADPSRAVQLYLSAGSNFYDSTTHTFRSNGASNYAIINSSGFNLTSGVFTGNASGLTHVNAVQLGGIDAVIYARTDINPNFQTDVTVAGIITATGGNSEQWNTAASFSSSFNISDYYLLLDARYQAPEALANVALSGSYNDLDDKPTIPVSGVDYVNKTGGTFSGAITAPSFIGNASTASNATQLGGIDAANYARFNVNNQFNTSQNIAGNLSLTGTGIINAPGNVLSGSSMKTGAPTGSTARTFKIGDIETQASYEFTDEVLVIDHNGTKKYVPLFGVAPI